MPVASAAAVHPSLQKMCDSPHAEDILGAESKRSFCCHSFMTSMAGCKYVLLLSRFLVEPSSTLFMLLGSSFPYRREWVEGKLCARHLANQGTFTGQLPPSSESACTWQSRAASTSALNASSQWALLTTAINMQRCTSGHVDGKVPSCCFPMGLATLALGSCMPVCPPASKACCIRSSRCSTQAGPSAAAYAFPEHNARLKGAIPQVLSCSAYVLCPILRVAATIKSSLYKQFLRHLSGGARGLNNRLCMQAI